MEDKGTGSGRLHRAGVPTDPDVTKLSELFDPLVLTKRTIRWEELAQVLRIGRQSSRFGTVVGAWRAKLEREQGIILLAIRGEGLRYAEPHERIDMAGRKVEQGVRLLQRGSVIAGTTDSALLTNDQRRVQAGLTALSTRLVTAARRVMSSGTKPTLPDGLKDK